MIFEKMSILTPRNCSNEDSDVFGHDGTNTTYLVQFLIVFSTWLCMFPVGSKWEHTSSIRLKFSSAEFFRRFDLTLAWMLHFQFSLPAEAKVVQVPCREHMHQGTDHRSQITDHIHSQQLQWTFEICSTVQKNCMVVVLYNLRKHWQWAINSTC